MTSLFKRVFSRRSSSVSDIADGTVESFFYDNDYRLRQMRRLRTTDAAGTFSKDQTYVYDANGNRISDEPYTYPNGVRTLGTPEKREYNSRSQLMKWERPARSLPGGVNLPLKKIDYTVDGTGAVTKKVEDGTATQYCFREYVPPTATSPETHKTHGDGYRLGRATQYPAGVSLPTDPCVKGTGFKQTSTFEYTGLGDVKTLKSTAGPSTSTTTYDFDAFGRLEGTQTVSSDGGTVPKPTMVIYDGVDRRERKCVDPGANLSTTCDGGKAFDYGYIGLTEMLSRDVSTSKLPDGSTRTEERTYDYTSDLQRLGQDRIPAGGTAKFRPYALDASGSVEGLENDTGGFEPEPGQTGSRTSAYSYDPYGNPIDEASLSAEAQENPFRFQGHYNDTDNDAYDMQARNYSPKFGRFLSADRYEAAGADLGLQSDPLTQDRYAFGSGNPVENVELDGHHAAGNRRHTDPGSSSSGSVSKTTKPVFDAHQEQQAWTDKVSAASGRVYEKIKGPDISEVVKTGWGETFSMGVPARNYEYGLGGVRTGESLEDIQYRTRLRHSRCIDDTPGGPCSRWHMVNRAPWWFTMMIPIPIPGGRRRWTGGPWRRQ